MLTKGHNVILHFERKELLGDRCEAPEEGDGRRHVAGDRFQEGGEAVGVGTL